MILFDSLYVNNGGGKVLLDYLVKKMHDSGLDVFYLFDERCIGSFDYIEDSRKTFLEGSIALRHMFYKQNKNKFSKVFCFGNIPPTLKLKVPVFTYFQNLILIRQVKDSSLKSRIILQIKGRFIRFHKQNTDYFIVQSESIKKELCTAYNLPEDRCLVIPFYEEHTYTNIDKKPGMFIYISKGHEHKNHLRLIEAWKIVNKSKPGYSLHLTVSSTYPALQQLIESNRANGVNVINHGVVERPALWDLYAMAPFVIYPSLIESFGLGLVEGFEAGCEVIAADEPYVHAILDPYKTFNPLSVQSIAETVLSIPEDFIKEKKLHTKLKISNGIDTLLDIFATAKTPITNELQ